MPQGELQGVRFNFLPGYPHNTSCLEEAGVREADCIIIGPADDLSDKEASVMHMLPVTAYSADRCCQANSSMRDRS